MLNSSSFNSEVATPQKDTSPCHHDINRVQSVGDMDIK